MSGSLIFHNLIMLPAPVCPKGAISSMLFCLHLCNSIKWRWGSKSQCSYKGQIPVFYLFFLDLIYLVYLSNEVPTLFPEWHWICTCKPSITSMLQPRQQGSPPRSYLLPGVMGVHICMSQSKGKLELESIQAGRGLSYRANETIHHSFV